MNRLAPDDIDNVATFLAESAQDLSIAFSAWWSARRAKGALSPARDEVAEPDPQYGGALFQGIREMVEKRLGVSFEDAAQDSRAAAALAHVLDEAAKGHLRITSEPAERDARFATVLLLAMNQIVEVMRRFIISGGDRIPSTETSTEPDPGYAEAMLDFLSASAEEQARGEWISRFAAKALTTGEVPNKNSKQANRDASPEQQPRPATRGAIGHRPGQVVIAVTNIACWFLPAAHRARYFQEFRAELFELPRWSRLAYALRQLGAAPMLRRDLAGWPSTDPAAEQQTSP
jgi:hypothetical protein